MLSVVLVIHLLIAFSLIGGVLLQKTDSSARGGRGGRAVSVNNLMRPRSRPNPLTRMTTYLGIAFFATSLGLAVIAKQQATTTSILDIPVGGSSEGIPSVSDSLQVPVAGSSDPAINLEPSLDSQVPMVPNE